MVSNGVKGFEGLIDLLDTISGGVYGNAGCFGCNISDMLVNVKVLREDGKIVVYSKQDLNFATRNSDFKRGILKGIILEVILIKEYGNRLILKDLADKNHKLRLQTQPGPKYNLGTTYFEFGNYTLFVV